MTIKQFNEINGIDDLKAMGTVEEIVEKINIIISPAKIESTSYLELNEKLKIIREKWSDFNSGPFLNKTQEYTFYLNYLDGKQRNKLLGITDEMYETPELAKQWYHTIAKLVHPDTGIDETSRAFIILKKIYDVMIDTNEDDLNEKQ